MRITNNLAAMRAFNSLSDTNLSLQNVIRALSTGLRINSAADDAAGFAVSEKMRSQIRGLDVALRNSQDGISMLQTAEGGLGGINSMLQRMRELAVQASNDSLTSTDRQYVQLEVDELRDQIDRIAETTQFNRKRLLNGSSGALWASSDSSVRALIYGGLKGAEGNYRIEVEADPGQAQVQKSHIFDIREINRITSYSTEYWELNIVDKVASSGATVGEGWNFSDDALNITADGTYYVVGNLDDQGNPVTTNTAVHVAAGVKASIAMR
ncbi:MAG: flagellin, partial [Synergistaceae bacterium]|nr:flagellin [Synergistaceae bacterium]